jgi:TolA-binding protein
MIQDVSTHSEENMSAVLIKLTGYSKYKVISIEDREMLVAFKDTEVSGSVYATETVLGDKLVRGIEIAQKPSQVACVVIKTYKPYSEIGYQVRERKDVLRVEIREKAQVSAGPTKEKSERVTSRPVSAPVASNGLPSSNGKGWSNDMFEIEGPVSTEDSELFQEALESYRKDEWDNAIEILKRIIESYRHSRHLEGAQFLLAKSFHRKHEGAISEFLNEIVRHYQVALGRFSNSKHAPYAMVSIGNCYFQADQYYEAMPYYNLVLNKYKDHEVAPEAMFYRGKILGFQEKPLLSLRCFDELRKRYPKSKFAQEARLQAGIGLFDVRSFKRSLKMFNEVRTIQPDEIYRNSDILLYTGYNYYELGRLQEAREVLSKALNYFPEMESADLVLTRIADTYREEGMEAKALRLYDLVAGSYGDSEGSLISLIRIAEGVEKAGVEKTGVLDAELPVKKTSRPAGQIYKEIVERFPNSPLSHVAMLKLGHSQKKDKRYEDSIRTYKDLLAKNPGEKLWPQIQIAIQDATLELAGVHREEGHFEESVMVLKDLLVQYPSTSLRAEVNSSLEESLGAVFGLKKQEGKIENLIGYYEQMKGSVTFQDMPDLLLQVGEAYKALHFYGHGLSVFQEARKAYGSKNRPSGLLIDLAECAYEEKKFDEAKGALKAFVGRYPAHQRASEAYFLLGAIFLKHQQYDKALKPFEVALRKNPDKGNRVKVLTGMAAASNSLGNHESAARRLEEVVSLLEGDKSSSSEALSLAYRELGETRFQQGYKDKALPAFEKAVELSPKDPHIYGLQFRLAQCYQWTGSPDEAEEMLSGIVASGDRFWSKVAQAQINDMNITASIDPFGQGLRKL